MHIVLYFLFIMALLACSSPQTYEMRQEVHLKNLRQLTASGENAEAYFSYAGDRLVYQARGEGVPCDQIFVMDLKGENRQRISNGKGVCTCAYFFPDDKTLLFSSTYFHDETCPPRPDYSQGYVWPLYNHDIFTANLDGSDIKPLFSSPRYDAEATISPDGQSIVFTTLRDGDLELYSMNLDGTNLKRLTHEVGYDGGAFFSPDSQKIVFRANRPQDKDKLEDYQRLLRQNLIRPTHLEIYVMQADGSNMRQITNNGKANFAPFWHPDGKRIIFASNMNDPKGRDFDLFLINENGTGLEQITFNPTFDGFPMFSPDGKYLAFSSNRHNDKQGDTNVFLAEWVE